MDPSLVVAQELDRHARPIIQSLASNTLVRANGGEDPNTFANQRRRVLRATLEGAGAAADGTAPHFAVDDGGLDDDDDGGFAMPSTIPTYALMGEGGGSSSSLFGSSAQKKAAAGEFEAHQQRLLPSKASVAAERKREREVVMADYDEQLLSVNTSRCVRCRTSLSAVLSEDQLEDLIALYRREARRAVMGNGNQQSTAPIPSLDSIAAPHVWCPSCIPFAPRQASCPLCASGGGGGGASPSATDEALLSAVFDLSKSDVFKSFAPSTAVPSTSYGSGGFGSRMGGGGSASSRTVEAQPMIKCLQCRQYYHGACLGMDAETSIALAAISEHNKYCCPRCSLESAVVAPKAKGSGGAAAASSSKKKRY